MTDITNAVQRGRNDWQARAGRDVSVTQLDRYRPVLQRLYTRVSLWQRMRRRCTEEFLQYQWVTLSLLVFPRFVIGLQQITNEPQLRLSL